MSHLDFRAPPRHDLSPAIARVLVEFNTRLSPFADEAVQVGIEACARKRWLQQVRHGVGAPVRAHLWVPGQELAADLLRRFVGETTHLVAPSLQVTPEKLFGAGQQQLLAPFPIIGPESVCLHRNWREGEVAWRRRFEAHLREHVAGLMFRMTNHVEARLIGIVERWNEISAEQIARATRGYYAPVGSTLAGVEL